MSEPLIKKRKIRLERMSDKKSIPSKIQYMSTKKGIIFADIDGRKNILGVEYDLRKVNFETIEKWLGEIQFGLSRGFFQKLKRGMAKFTEQNELDHLNAPVSSCCDDPKSYGPDCNRCMTR